jgi:hypothetical protein
MIGKSLLIDKWSSIYTTDKSFLKETQTFIKTYKINKVDTSDISKKYSDFISETNFIDKYQYMSFKALQPLNKSGTFLHCLGLYNLGAPIFSLCAPLCILIVPFIILKAKGTPITINIYIEFLKNLLKNTSIYKLFSSGMGSQQKISAIVSLFIYSLQVYNNIFSCISFYKNINVIYSFLNDYKDYLIKTDNMINEMKPHLSQFKTYEDFSKDMLNEQVFIQRWIQKLKRIVPTKHIVFKVGQLGLLLQMYYELFYEDRCRFSFSYSIHLHQFNEDILLFNNLIKNKKIGKCKFGSETKFKGLYYLAHMEDKHVTNNISLEKNILLSGPNASGKTSVLKSILLNVLLSQTIGYGCYKKATISCYDRVHSYLNIPDTSGRDSLFQAEVRRCQEIMNTIEENKEQTHLCIFDELMSGTNPSDAISCAEVYLNDINSHKNHVDYIITTHYVKLCEVFDKNPITVNMKMNVDIKDDKINYLYKIENGISNVNGGKFVIKQMKEHSTFRK